MKFLSRFLCQEMVAPLAAHGDVCGCGDLCSSRRTCTIVVRWFIYCASIVLTVGLATPNIGWPLSVTGESDVNTSAVVGSTAELACDIVANADDRTHLVLWYKQDSGNPIYTLDLRQKKAAITTQFPPEDIRSRVKFFAEVKSPYLLIRDVRAGDQGFYRCRVDFKNSRTRNGLIYLNVVVPPATPSILDEKGLDLGPSIGPYNEGSSLFLSCEVVSGRPPPRVTWWRNSTMLDDIFEVTHVGTVRNDLLVQSLSRSDMKAVFTCQASNNNITPPVSSSVSVDMNLKPLEIKILTVKQSLSAGKQYTIKCRSTGSRPPPMIAWWKDQNVRLTQTDEALSADGNVTTSIVKFTPVDADNGKHIACRAENPAIQGSAIQDGWILDIHFAPILLLFPGESVRLDNIREGDDVYLECNIRSNPTALRIEWKFQGKVLNQSNSGGILTNNQSLVLQNVRRKNSGSYSCAATNSEGEGESDKIILQVKHAPVCRANYKSIYRMARLETVKIICEVDAYPANVSFRWKANRTNDVGVNFDFTRERSRSVLTYVPMIEKDFGKFFCYAGNDVGEMETPCIFSVEPAGPPDPVSNCSVINQTETSVGIDCHSGYDGGLSQSYTCEVFDTVHGEVKRILTSDKPSFQIDELDPGLNYVFSVSSHNDKGSSEARSLMTATAKKLSATRVIDDNDDTSLHGQTEKLMTTMLGVVIGIIVAIGLIVITVMLVMSRLKTSTDPLKHHKDCQQEQADRSNVPLRKDMDDGMMMDTEEKSPDIICNTTEQEFPSVKVKCLQKWAYGSDDDLYAGCLRPHHHHHHYHNHHPYHPVLSTFTGIGGCVSDNNVRYPARKIQPFDEPKLMPQPDIQMQANHPKFRLESTSTVVPTVTTSPNDFNFLNHNDVSNQLHSITRSSHCSSSFQPTSDFNVDREMQVGYNDTNMGIAIDPPPPTSTNNCQESSV